MTHKDRLMSVLRGGKADRIPFTIYKWLIPDVPAAEELRRKGLTPIDAAPVFSIERKDVSFEQEEVTEDGKRFIRSRISTPVGEITEVAGFDSVYGSRWIIEHYIKTVEDYKVWRFLCEQTTVVPTWDQFMEADRAMGDDGIVIAWIDPIPVQALLVEYMGTETWSEGVMAYEEEFGALHDSLMRVYKRQVDIAAECPAEVVWLPDNVTGSIMSPKRFEMYCKPAYDYACRVLKQAGKLTFAHYDGQNHALRECIAATDIDIIEAFTPPPMERMTVAEARAAWPDKVLSLNFPGNLFREPADVIRRWIREYVEQAGDPKGFIIGCTEDFHIPDFEHAFNAIADAMY